MNPPATPPPGHLLPCGHRVRDAKQVHYCSYLHLDELLGLQPAADEVHHPDEHLFVVTHQSFELWFSQLRWELRRIIDALERDDVGFATRLAQRCAGVLRLLSPMMRVLEGMTPTDFFAFRAHLSPATGSESGQWHEVELLAGAREERFRQHLETELSEEAEQGSQSFLWTERLAELWNGPSVASACQALLERRGVSPADIYREDDERGSRHSELVLLAEALLDFDEEVRIWRWVHARTAERTIGPDVEGTGHTTGVRYLDAAALHREPFFPFLWKARAELWERQQNGKP
ncbi:tryptophan 2,3-dioxygenase [soil metagenome]